MEGYCIQLGPCTIRRKHSVHVPRYGVERSTVRKARQPMAAPHLEERLLPLQAVDVLRSR